MEKVTLLWSGGWYGTFRFMQLMESNVIIQSVYIIDKERKSAVYECKAMETISEMAKARYDTINSFKYLFLLKKNGCCKIVGMKR